MFKYIDQVPQEKGNYTSMCAPGILIILFSGGGGEALSQVNILDRYNSSHQFTLQTVATHWAHYVVAMLNQRQ